MTDHLTLGQQAAQEASAAALAPLQVAGAAGMTPTEALAASGLPERRWRRAIERLVTEGEVRRDGRTRLWALRTPEGAPADLDVEGRRRRELAGYRGWTLGQITDAVSLLDGRRIPLGQAGRAKGARDYLRQLADDVDLAHTVEEIETLVREATPWIGEVRALVGAVESARQAVEDAEAREAGERVRLRAAADRLRPIVRDFDRVIAGWRRQHAVPWSQVDAELDRLGRIIGWESMWRAYYTHGEDPRPEMPRGWRLVGAVLEGLAAASDNPPADPRWTSWTFHTTDGREVHRTRHRGHATDVPAGLPIPGPAAAELAAAPGQRFRADLTSVEARIAELSARTRRGDELARLTAAALPATPVLDATAPRAAITARVIR